MRMAELKAANELKKEMLELRRRERRYRESGETLEARRCAEKALFLFKKAMKEELKVLEFIEGIEDAHIRRLISLRFLDGLSWTAVAMKVGGGNTSDSVRKTIERFLKNNSR